MTRVNLGKRQVSTRNSDNIDVQFYDQLSSAF